MVIYTKMLLLVLAFSSTAFGAILKNLGAATGEVDANAWSNPLEAQKAALQFCKEQKYSMAFKAIITPATPCGWKHAKELIRTCFQSESGACLLSQKACSWMRKCLVAEGACKRPPAKAIMDEFARSKKMRHMLDGEEPEDADFRAKVESFVSQDVDMWALAQGAFLAGVNSLRAVSARSMERLHGYGFIEAGIFFKVVDSYDERALREAQETAMQLGAPKEQLIDAVHDPNDRKKFLQGITAGLFFTVACSSQYLQHGGITTHEAFTRVGGIAKGGKEYLIEGGPWMC